MMVKKILLLFVLVFFSGGIALLKAQCYAVVHLDSYVDSGGATGSTFTITTAYPNELILIGYDGWATPGAGPVMVDGNSATHINTAHTGNSAVAEVYCYSAPLADVHTIVCTETGYTSPYYLNFAASFYATGSCTPLSCSDLITTETSTGITSHYDTDIITTTTPNEMIFCTAVYNTGAFPSNRLHLRGVKTLDTLHKGNGVDASDADTVATVAGTYTVTSSDVNSCCGGEIILVAIVPPLCGSTYTISDSVVNANCLGDSGKAIVTVNGGVGPFTYSWSPVGGTADSATGLSAGTYTVAIADADGCTASASVTITEPTIHTTVSSIPADSACAGQNVILNVSGATNYLWSTGATGSSITVVIPTGDTAYYGVKGMMGACSDSTPLKIKIIPKITASIRATHDTICPRGVTTITTTGSGGQLTYKWNTGATTSSILVTDTVNTRYIVTVYGICDSVKDIIMVIVSPLPKPVISGIRSKCPGSTDTLNVSGGASYKWANGSTSDKYITGSINADSTITVVAYNSQGCSDTAHFTITLSPLPVITLTDTNTCLNSPVSIHASASGAGTFTYLWARVEKPIIA